MWWFCNQVRRLWLQSLRRRSQKASLFWECFTRIADRFFPPIKVYTCCLFTASTPKPEGGARCVSSARRTWAAIWRHRHHVGWGSAPVSRANAVFQPRMHGLCIVASSVRDKSLRGSD
jgi:hypothetical protein